MDKLSRIVSASATVVATTTLVGMTSANIVNAEEVKPVETPVEVVETAVSPEVTPEQLEKAVEERDNTTEEVSKAEAVVEVTENKVETANAEVDRLESDVEKGELATPEVIDQAKTDAEKAQKAEEDAKDQVIEAEETVKPLEEAKTQAESDEAEAKADADKATKDLADVEAEKALVEKALDPAEIAKAEQEAEDARKDAEAKTTEVDNAKVALEDAKAKDAETTQAVANAKADMDAKLADKTEKESKAAELKVASDNAKAELDKALAPKYNGISANMPLTQEFVDAFKAWMDFRATNQDLALNNYDEYKRLDNQHKANVLAAEKKTASEMKDLYVLENGDWKYYMSVNPNGDATMEALFKQLEQEVKTAQRYDVSNLPNSLRTELNQYAVDVFNNIRSQFGLSVLKVNANAMNFAKDVANIVERDNYSVMGHYVKGIQEVAGKYGVNTKDNYYENLMSSNFSKMLTKNEMFAIMADAIRSFFYEGTNGNPNYGHARSLYNMDAGIGLDFSVTNDGTRDVVKLHLISVPLATTNKADFDDRWSNNSPASINSTSEDVTALRDAYNKALANYATAQGEATAASTNYEIAKRVHAEKLAIPLLTPDATTRVTNAQAELDKAIVVEAVATQKVAELKELAKNGKERLAEIQKAITTATANKVARDKAYANAHSASNEARNKYNVALAKISEAKQVYQKAKSRTELANAKVKELETLRANLDQNRASLLLAQQNKSVTLEELAASRLKLAEAQALAKIAYENWERLSKRYAVEEAIRQVEQQKLANNKSEVEKNNNLSINHSSSVQLPNTGETNMNLVFSLAALNILASVGLFVRKRERDR